jgi:hypothetical protein
VWYVEEDLNAGNFVRADYDDYPTVTSASDIWSALTPTGLEFMTTNRDHDSIISLDVFWPNPHYFVAYLDETKLCLLDVVG